MGPRQQLTRSCRRASSQPLSARSSHSTSSASVSVSISGSAGAAGSSTNRRGSSTRGTSHASQHQVSQLTVAGARQPHREVRRRAAGDWLWHLIMAVYKDFNCFYAWQMEKAAEKRKKKEVAGRVRPGQVPSLAPRLTLRCCAEIRPAKAEATRLGDRGRASPQRRRTHHCD